MSTKTHMGGKTEEFKAHFKACLTRASYLQTQGYLTRDGFKAVRERIPYEQGRVLEAVAGCQQKSEM